jgi:hypothetical protein
VQGKGPFCHQRPHKAHAVAEAVEDRALADAGCGGDLFHRDLLGPVPRQEFLGRQQDRVPISCRVGTFAAAFCHRVLTPHGQLD